MKTEQELELSGLRELLARATPGPWFASDRRTGAAKIDVFAKDGDSVQTASHVARCGGKPPEQPMLSELDGIWEGERIAREGEANAALIVAAVNRLPALLSRTEQAEARVKEAADLLADRSTELDNERQARQAAEASVKELEEEIERRAAQEEMDDSLRDGCMDSLLAAESSLKERNEEVERLREALDEIATHPGPHADEAAHWRADTARSALSHQGGKA